MSRTKILIPNHDLDFVTRRVFEQVGKNPDIDVVIAGPGEGARGGVEAVRITSKFSLKAIRDYRRVMRSEGITMTFSPSTSGLATMLSASLGLGIANIGYRGTQARVRRSDPTNYLALLNGRVRHVVCETADIIESLGALIGRNRVSGMPKPYELSWVDDAMSNPVPYPTADNITERTFKLIYIGMSQGRPHKGLQQLVDAMALLGDRDIHLCVIGSYDESTAAGAAPGRVTFAGPRPGAVACIPGCDALVLPSLRDASPRVVREAQACGVPCIVTDIPGARDLIIDGTTGLLVRPDSPQAIADAVCRMYDDRTLHHNLSRACRPYIRDNYAMAPYVEYFINLIHSQCEPSTSRN